MNTMQALKDAPAVLRDVEGSLELVTHIFTRSSQTNVWALVYIHFRAAPLPPTLGGLGYGCGGFKFKDC